MDGDSTTLILIASLTVVLLVVVIIIIFSIFQNRKIKFLFEQKETKQRFDEELIKSKLETQEQTLQNISWELHDNIGQLLSVARMQLNIVQPNLTEEQKSVVQETGEIISKSLQEIRSLSKLLNPEVVKNIGLHEAIQLEIDRFNRLNFINAEFNIEGKVVPINQKDEIILFRIIQEFLSNSVKHSKTNSMEISANYNKDTLAIKIQDFGIGFDGASVEKGSGLLNMKSRAKLINTEFDLKSGKDKGVSLTLTYPIRKKDA
ncbi:histidine kinase [Aureibaculum sp. 2210JD6-5]|uniref:sensor histidine kinase n=1 Tax=Aureibaculum sp. 2210JD6-5 TaxID=3103957 RepID=UPI002AAE5611|nr:histidine kinase [Aureibaculum sp. 2210JD6-5]MDY7396408.1 histidine kinase [Aureibaculum sp. 2210JD6-5]